MTRAEVRRRLALEWWRWLGFALAPLFFLNLLFGGSQALGSVLEMPLFIAGVASMFVSLPLFSAYKRALIATQAALDNRKTQIVKLQQEKEVALKSTQCLEMRSALDARKKRSNPSEGDLRDLGLFEERYKARCE